MQHNRIIDPFMHQRHDHFRGPPPPPGEPPFGPRGDFRSGPMPRGGGYMNGPRGAMFTDRGGFHGSPRDRDGHYYHPDRGRGGHVGPPYYYVPDERDYRKRGPGDHFGYKRHTVGPYGTHSFRYEHV